MNYIRIRNSWYYFKRRIPTRYRQYYNDQAIVEVSLKTQSEAIAIQRADVLKAELQKLWDKLESQESIDKNHEHDQAVQIAQSFDFSYRPSSELAQADLEKIINRVQTIMAGIPETENNIIALLGGENIPGYFLETALNDYFEFEKPNLSRKSADQLRKWKNPKIRAVRNFIAVCGDISAEKINRDHILKFRSWWNERVEAEKLSANSPNKDFSHLRTLLFFAKDHKSLDISVEGLFARIRLKETKSTKPPFKTDFIRDQLLVPQNLKGLEPECKLFLYAMTDLGARPSELVGLDVEKGDIRLDTDIPFIHIREDKNKELKTAYSERVMPLVGASLYAFQQLPLGFEHYYRKPDHLSDRLNKFLRNNALLPTNDHSVYSLRHSFEDRLTAVEPPEKVQAALMGHKYSRERYGDGPSLGQKHKWLQKIALDVEAIIAP